MTMKTGPIVLELAGVARFGSWSQFKKGVFKEARVKLM